MVHQGPSRVHSAFHSPHWTSLGNSPPSPPLRSDYDTRGSRYFWYPGWHPLLCTRLDPWRKFGMWTVSAGSINHPATLSRNTLFISESHSTKPSEGRMGEQVGARP